MSKIAVTLREASALSGIGRSSLYKLFNEGKLNPRKAGKRTLIIVSELEEFLRSLPQGARKAIEGDRMPADEPPPPSQRG